MQITNDISVQEEIELELGPRVFRCLSAENGPHGPHGFNFIQGISAYKMLTDRSGEDWSDITSLMHDDRQSDFTLLQGALIMVRRWQEMGASEETLEVWFNAWEANDYDAAHEEWVRSDLFEQWISDGGMDDIFPEEDRPPLR